MLRHSASSLRLAAMLVTQGMPLPPMSSNMTTGLRPARSSSNTIDVDW
nr:hypothetical protein [Chenggangzhangella methanolivorans]